VIFVPTEQAVVDEMLRMAQLSKDSVVYDLGCGDGRIVITAAIHYGARGVGIDIDPERIRESRQNARAAGVSNRVKFIQGDLFETDFHEATAVMLYLSSAVNVRLRPILLRQLKPGTPVVSHDFLMGDWQPDEINSVNGAAILLWIVPARVAGVWQWTVNNGIVTDRYELTLRQEFQKLTGTLAINGKEEALSAVKLVGDRMEFESAQRRFSGQVADGKLNGLLTEGTRDFAWTATRSETTAGDPIE
jgi:SAM-dependent methyltransferase